MKTIVLLLILLSVPVLSGSSDVPVRASLLSESRVFITGSSTVNRFECEAGAVSGMGHVDDGRVEARMVVPVETVDCGKQRMNQDMQNALKAGEHPEIRFELTDDRVLVPREAGGFRVKGVLTIAGEARSVVVEASVRPQRDGIYRVSGQKQISMSDFGIAPPTALAGLIKAHDQIVVHFDLVATTNLGRLER